MKFVWRNLWMIPNEFCYERRIVERKGESKGSRKERRKESRKKERRERGCKERRVYLTMRIYCY